MPKKIIDIFPPQKLEKYQTPLSEKKIPKEEKLTPVKSKKGKFFKRGLFLISLLLVLTFISLQFFLSRANIEIWPETEVFNSDEKVTVDGKTDKLDLASKIIPGKIFETEKTVSEEFSASGSFLKKAGGTIRLYNAYSAQSEIWQTGTRFVSSEGKLFLSKNKINVPGAQIKDGKITPSFVDVPVVAAQGGSDYNIGPSNFSIFIYRGTLRYTKFYGESSEAMTVGGESAQVTKEDLERAESILIERAKTDSEAALRSEIPDEYVFSDKAVETKILEKFSSVGAGTEAEKFNFQIKMKSTTISFKSKDVEDFATLFILSQVPQGKKLYQESLKTKYLPETVNLESGKLILSINLSAKIYPEIDLDSLKKALVAKSLIEAKILLGNQPGIVRSEIRPFPFWLGSIPDNLEKIKIELRFD